MNDDLKKSPAIYRDFDELEQRVLAMGSALDAATTTGRNLTKVLVVTGTPAAPGRRKVGVAQWKSERRGGFSRR